MEKIEKKSIQKSNLEIQKKNEIQTILKKIICKKKYNFDKTSLKISKKINFEKILKNFKNCKKSLRPQKLKKKTYKWNY